MRSYQFTLWDQYTTVHSRRSHAEASQSRIVKLAYNPKRATADIRHLSSIGSRSTSSPSPASVVPFPLSADHHSSAAKEDDDDNGRDRYSRDRSCRSYFQPFLLQYLSQTTICTGPTPIDLRSRFSYSSLWFSPP
ncbi:DNA-directed RNA polymerase subunit beta [Striga asiatica]|uniref:DNA-directed RNA polymerase subunit beta n=1 Tax=Striga asiatica TaxID=4170 RepID=A0A5A7PYZ0_STRAF|nr:DNA-directed RNA polymerase subunit beta [Striga asiatica]